MSDPLEPRERSEYVGSARERADLLATMLQESSQPFAAATGDGRLLEFNRAYEELTGYSADELRALSWRMDLTPPEWHDVDARSIDEQQRTGEAIRYEKEYLRKDGTRIPVEVFRNAHRDERGEIDYYYAFFTDLTERKRAEEALHDTDARVRRKLDALIEPAGDIGELELADVIDADAIRAMMEDFYALTHMPIGIIDLKGEVVVGVGWQDVCTRFHRVNPETCKHCIESDTELTRDVPVGESRLYKCKNGMWDIASPIFVGTKQVGNLFSGQFLFDDEPPDLEFFRAQARQYGFDEEEYLAAVDAVPRLSRRSLDTGMSFLMQFAETISQLSYSTLTLARSLAERDALSRSLRQSRDDLEQAQRVAQVGSWRLDTRINDLSWSDETYRMFGVPAGSSLDYEAFLRYVHPDDRESVDADVAGRRPGREAR